jgi:3-phenylpropionate/trans-cinnamate dioxygenase ferredoxin subunit
VGTNKREVPISPKKEVSMEYLEAAQIGQISPGTAKGFSLGQKEVLLTNIDGKYYAIGRKCTHFGGDLSKGKLEGKVVTCPRHGSQFDVTTGKRLAGAAKKDLPLYEVKIEGNSIMIGF